jgi:hypothetical protein
MAENSLRFQICECANDILRNRLVCCSEPREAEIDNLYSTLAAQNHVRRLDVAVNDAALMRVFKAEEDGLRDVDCLLQIDPASPQAI